MEDLAKLVLRYHNGSSVARDKLIKLRAARRKIITSIHKKELLIANAMRDSSIGMFSFLNKVFAVMTFFFCYCVLLIL
jgi:hypothetical protein